MFSPAFPRPVYYVPTCASFLSVLYRPSCGLLKTICIYLRLLRVFIRSVTEDRTERNVISMQRFSHGYLRPFQCHSLSKPSLTGVCRLGLHNILHVIFMRISSVKAVLWLAVNLHQMFSNGAAFNSWCVYLAVAWQYYFSLCNFKFIFAVLVNDNIWSHQRYINKYFYSDALNW